jgi:protein TonB
MLAVGFEELSAKAVAPPPLAPVPAVAAPTVAAPSIPQPPRIYNAGESNVTPPVPLNQVLPAYPGQVIVPRSGKLEVVIDESGAVESAAMTASVTASYDRLALTAAKTWRFRPATIDGAPVKFRKVVQISIKKTS